MSALTLEEYLTRLQADDRDRLNALNSGIQTLNHIRFTTPDAIADEGLREVLFSALSEQLKLRIRIARFCAPWFEVQQ